MTRPQPDRLQQLEAEQERLFREAQLAADTIFAQYQLSQILASHATPRALAAAVIDELVHVCGAAGGALWLTESPSDRAILAAARGLDPDAVDLERLTPGRAVIAGSQHWTPVALDDGARRVGLLVIASAADRPLPRSQHRFLSLVRHELALALRAAQLREALERERSELAAIIEGASDAIVLVDERQRVVRVNGAAVQLLGGDRERLAGLPCREALACGDGAGCPGGCPFERVFTSGDPVRGVECTFGGPGEPISAVASYTLASRSSDGAALAVGIFHNTTQLAQLAELRRGFVATISHELRTPLALIKGYTETLLHLDPSEQSARAYLRRIDDTADRLAGLVRQILDVTHLVAGGLVLDRAPADLAALLDEACAELRLRHPALEVELRVDPRLAPIEIDAGRLRQVVDNLLDNAAKYGPVDGKVGVSALLEDGALTLRIQDEGIGVPAEERTLVLEQFHRASNVRERPAPGYGLGLAISRTIVEAHGGRLALEGEPGGGTTVLVSLPLSERIADPVPA